MSKGNSSVIKGFLWKFAESVAPQFVSLVVSVILARILSPSDYGTISVVMVFITIANVFVNEGLGSALIQKKNVDALDYSSVLYVNTLFSILLYIIVCLLAPMIASFYGSGYADLCLVLRVLGLRIVFVGINSVQQAYISKKMQFRKLFGATLLATLVSAIIGISMAYGGYGVWALVAQNLASTLVSTVYLCFSIHKLPILAISFSRLKGLLDYGFRILGAGLLSTGYQELRALIIGKLYSAQDLAFYDKGRQFPNLVVTNINTSISAVLFPRMAQDQDNISEITRITRYSIRICAYIMTPLMLGLAAVARPFVSVILTEKWLPCVPLMQMFCIIYLFQPIHTANLQAIKAIGRSDIYLKLEIIKKTIELASLLAVMWISVDAIVISMAILTTLFTVINAYPNIKLLNYSFLEQLKDIMAPFVMSGVMFCGVMLAGLLPVSMLTKLVVQVLVGIAIYLLLSIITKNKEFYLLLETIKTLFH